MRPITRLLIANRGEIACRIARTARRLGIETVGVYSDPDRDALHTDAVDIAVALGGATPAESYLRGDLIIDIAQRTGADAIHPGYGFLAENADFAAAVDAAGLAWVGPTPDQIRLLGDKVAAKRAAVDAGVPTTPIVEVADGEVPTGLTMPVLVKAAAGGGGRGMRIVRDAGELADAIAAASREAAAAFGDGTVFIEPYLERGRHIEVQIMGDAHGHVVHLHERDCSVQRRNQKVIEEAPAPALDDAVRQRLHDGAVALARHVGYRNAGTVEFLVGDDGTINFLEVNTRLQVEHPVTEAITGLDLVELQLRVAEGAPLGVEQTDVVADGHAIELRLVAEDPTTGWLPSVGTITRFEIDGPDGMRVDTGFRAGSSVSSDYDSLLAKVIDHAADRATVCRRLAATMRTADVAGVATNADALAAILSEPDFVAGGVPTAYLAEHPTTEAARGPEGDDLDAHVVAAALYEQAVNRAGDTVTGFAPSGWRNLSTHGQRRTYRRGDDDLQVEYTMGTAPTFLLGPWPEPSADGSLPADERRACSVTTIRTDLSTGEVVFELDGRRRAVTVDATGDRIGVGSRAGRTTLVRPPRFVEPDADAAAGGPVCPLPGTVIAVHVAAGDAVDEGQLLMVVEAMKMEHKITAGSAATVSEVRFAVGDRVDAGDLLVALEAD
ncbi:MAG: ATP-grasp domain-containing protein [Ilumatobacter sp.]|nr:ATP-grasp domain-containing protein [Ilumatobacter sp.]